MNQYVKFIVLTIVGGSLITCEALDPKTSKSLPKQVAGYVSNDVNSYSVDSLAIQDSIMLDKIQLATFKYMWDGGDKTSGMAYERFHLDGGGTGNNLTTGGTGFGVAGIIVAIQRGFITRQEGVARISKIVNFLSNADRFHGVWPHWLSSSGKVIPFGTDDDGGDLVESCFLMEGLLCAKQFLNPNDTTESAIIKTIQTLWQEMEFDWYTNNQNVLYWHWSPNYGWQKNMALRGYNECMIVYILAASSPTHAISANCYHQGWCRNGGIKSSSAPYGYNLEVKHNYAETYGGPLFWAHYSWFGLCPKGLSDQYANYWNVVRNHTMANYQFCVSNPNKKPTYSANCWGLTACYIQNDEYSACAPNNDQGVVAPTAALSSMPYSPEQSLVAARYFSSLNWLNGRFGFYDSFTTSPQWRPQRYLAIDQLIIAPMIENYRSELLWKLFMRNQDIQNGLRKLSISSAYDPYPHPTALPIVRAVVK